MEPALRPRTATKYRQAEDEILNIFVDICSLFQREPEVNDRASGEEPSAEAYLFSYLRMLDTRGEGLPPAFVERAPARAGSLRRADAGSLARTGRELALDLQIAPTRGTASRAGSGRSGTASAPRAEPIAARGGILSDASRPDDLHDQRALSRRQRPGPGSALSLLRPAAV